MTLLLEDKGPGPDRNQPDRRVRIDSICLVYGFKSPHTEQLNGRKALIIDRAMGGPAGFFANEDIHFQVAIHGLPGVYILSLNNLTLLDDSDDLVIEILSRD